LKPKRRGDIKILKECVSAKPD